MSAGRELVGEVVGNYRIESLIDEGGMGRVYRARHLILDRLAAIKIMLPELEAVPGYRARFHQEARAAAALRHPNVVEVYECGEQGGRFYLAMELVPDGNLLTLMRGQRAQRQPERPVEPKSEPRTEPKDSLSLALGLDLVRQAALGLDYAHDHGMVHRDVKPANLLLEAIQPKRGPLQASPASPAYTAYTVKVSDFGLARLREGGIETTIGKVRGTLAYMSPEQCQGLDLDGRSDLYALGIILFELSTGKRPFEVKSPADALYKHIYQPPPSPRSFRPELPEELAAIILRCLAKQPDQRYRSCGELARQLESLMHRGALAGDSEPIGARVEVSTSLLALPIVRLEPEDPREGKVVVGAAGDAPVGGESATEAGVTTGTASDGPAEEEPTLSRGEAIPPGDAGAAPNPGGEVATAEGGATHRKPVPPWAPIALSTLVGVLALIGFFAWLPDERALTFGTESTGVARLTPLATTETLDGSPTDLATDPAMVTTPTISWEASILPPALSPTAASLAPGVAPSSDETSATPTPTLADVEPVTVTPTLSSTPQPSPEPTGKQPVPTDTPRPPSLPTATPKPGPTDTPRAPATSAPQLTATNTPRPPTNTPAPPPSTPARPVAPPASVGIASVTSNTTTIKWKDTNPPDRRVTGFWIDRAPVITGPWTQAGFKPKTDSTSATRPYVTTIGGLAPSTTYCWRVVAGTSTSRLAYSSVVCGDTAPAGAALG